MLDLVRKHSASWIVYAMLGMIVIVFVFFFGSASIRNPGTAANGAAAAVNGEPIAEQSLTGLLNLQKENNPTLKNLPESLMGQVRSQLLNEMIEAKVTEDAAKKLGLRVTDAELAAEIRKAPNLAQNGQFNQKFYQEQFLPAYREQYGIDYEEFVRQSLLQQKLRDLFLSSVIVSDKALQDAYDARHTRVTLQQVAISPGSLAKDYKPSKDEVDRRLELKKQAGTEVNAQNEDGLRMLAEKELKDQHGASKAKELADKLWPLFLKDELRKGALKEYNLNEQDLAGVSLEESQSIANRPLTPEELTQVFSLNESKRFLDKPLESNGSYFFIKLVKKESPSPDEFAKAKDALREELKSQLAGQTYTRWYAEQARQAKIEIYR